jgi:hypothetical protein
MCSRKSLVEVEESFEEASAAELAVIELVTKMTACWAEKSTEVT